METRRVEDERKMRDDYGDFSCIVERISDGAVMLSEAKHLCRFPCWIQI